MNKGKRGGQSATPVEFSNILRNHHAETVTFVLREKDFKLSLMTVNHSLPTVFLSGEWGIPRS
jgi:hypothetical protein